MRRLFGVLVVWLVAAALLVNGQQQQQQPATVVSGQPQQPQQQQQPVQQQPTQQQQTPPQQQQPVQQPPAQQQQQPPQQQPIVQQQQPGGTVSFFRLRLNSLAQIRDSLWLPCAHLHLVLCASWSVARSCAGLSFAGQFEPCSSGWCLVACCCFLR